MVMLVIVVALMIPLLAVILDSQLVRALAARLEREGKAVDPSMEPRLDALEAEVEQLAQGLKRIEEETRFVQQLLEERAKAPDALPPGETEREPEG